MLLKKHIMSDAYVNGVLRYCIGVICKKCGVGSVTQSCLEYLVKLVSSDVQRIGRQIVERSNPYGTRSLSDIMLLNLLIPNGRNRQWEIHVHLRLLENCKYDRKQTPSVSSIPFSVPPLFGVLRQETSLNRSLLPKVGRCRKHHDDSEPDCSWDSGDPSSKLFSSPSAIPKPKFASAAAVKRFSTSSSTPCHLSL